MRTDKEGGRKATEEQKEVMRKVTREERWNCWRGKTKEEAEEGEEKWGEKWHKTKGNGDTHRKTCPPVL